MFVFKALYAQKECINKPSSDKYSRRFWKIVIIVIIILNFTLISSKYIRKAKASGSNSKLISSLSLFQNAQILTSKSAICQQKGLLYRKNF